MITHCTAHTATLTGAACAYATNHAGTRCMPLAWRVGAYKRVYAVGLQATRGTCRGTRRRAAGQPYTGHARRAAGLYPPRGWPPAHVARRPLQATRGACQPATCTRRPAAPARNGAPGAPGSTNAGGARASRAAGLFTTYAVGIYGVVHPKNVANPTNCN